jgi:hypothetical protein
MAFEKSDAWVVEENFVPCVFYFKDEAVGAALVPKKLFPFMNIYGARALLAGFVKSADVFKIITKGEWEAIVAFELLPIYKGHMARSQMYAGDISYVTINRLDKV